jgi:hypothetical protein
MFHACTPVQTVDILVPKQLSSGLGDRLKVHIPMDRVPAASRFLFLSCVSAMDGCY